MLPYAVVASARRYQNYFRLGNTLKKVFFSKEFLHGIYATFKTFRRANSFLSAGVDSPYAKWIIVWRQELVWSVSGLSIKPLKLCLTSTFHTILYAFSIVSHKVSLLNFFSITFLSTSHELAQQFLIRNSLKFPNFYFSENIVPSSSGWVGYVGTSTYRMIVVWNLWRSNRC